MTDKLTAGERLVPRTPDAHPNSGSPPPRPPASRPPRRRSGPLRLFGWIFGALAGLAVLGGGVGAVVGYVAYQRFSTGLPDVDGLRNYQPPVMSRVYAADSSLLSELATERRIFVPYPAIPDVLRHAFISAEDQNFFSHPGVDPVAIARAAATDFLTRGHRRPVGASTITQQVARNMLLGSNELSLARKAREAILALRIDKALPKERVLELYLNEIYLGMGAYGVAAAGQVYFNKSLDQLSIADCAFLAALPKAPNNYNPIRFPDAAKARRDWVLDRMAEDHAITAAQAEAAKAEPIGIAQFRRPETLPGASYFAEEVRRRLIERFGADQTTQGGLVVHTSLDPTLQAAAERALRDGLMRYDHRRGGWRGPLVHIAVTPANWAAALGQVARPPGMLTEWRLAVVLSETASEAQMGVLDPGAPTPARVLALSLSDLAWARPVHIPAGAVAPPPGTTLGPVPRRMADVVQPGDVVMVEITPAQPAQGKTPARGEHLTLRQIPLVEGALVAIEPQTGRVLALTGGWSFEISQFNRATQGNRQPGSSFKPFVYLTALESGFSPSQRFLDAPFVLDQGAAGQWRPNNYEMDFLGPVPLRIALERSLNLVTVRVANTVGMDAVAKTAIGFHEVDDMPRVLPAALGAVDTTPLREAGAYAGLANYGRAVVPTLIDSVQDRDGHVIWRAPDVATCDAACADPTRPPPVPEDARPQVADPASAFQLVTMMQGVTTRGTGVDAMKGLGGRPVAGKTGTSQDWQDAWFAGFTPDLVTVVWTGYDAPTSLGTNETGAAVSAPIWNEFMKVALQNRPKLSFPVPPGVTMTSWDSGFGTVTDAFKPGQQPGASQPLGTAASGDTAASSAASAAPASPGAGGSGVDSGMGGLY